MSKSIQHKELTIAGITVDVDFYYYPGRPAVHYLPNGDPGYPEEFPEVDILHVWLEGTDIGDFLYALKGSEVLEDLLFEAMVDDEEDTYDED